MLALLLSCGGLSDFCSPMARLSESCQTGPRSDWRLLAMQDDAIYEISTLTGRASIFARTGWGAGSFTADVRADGVPFSSSDTFFEINHCAGARTEIAALPTKVQGMAFTGDDRLLGLSRHTDTIVDIHPQTGELTTFATLPFDLGRNGMAYDRDEDILYGLDADSAEVFVIDPITGETDSFVSVDIEEGLAYVGMEYSPGRGVLWVTTGEDLYELDPRTGEASLVGGHYSSGPINDLALFPPCE